MAEYIQSLDPRIIRLNIREDQEYQPKDLGDQWETYEVFHQAKTGARLIHVGSLHAPSPEMALVFAKEQFGRRGTTTDLWVVRTTDIFTLQRKDMDIFATVQEKLYREPAGYKEVRKYIEEFKKEQMQKEQSENRDKEGTVNGGSEEKSS